MKYSTDYKSPLGKMFMLSDGETLNGLWFYNQKHFPICSHELKDDLTIFSDVKNWLDDYFRGNNPKIDFKINPQGTKFQIKVWTILTEILYGSTLTYGEIARKISPNMSAQAVGGAVGHNPIVILIPCHRVLGSNGRLTGYAAGLDKKRFLLMLEKSLITGG